MRNFYKRCLMCCLLTISFSSASQVHKEQIADPSKLHEVMVEAGVTKILAASTRDLNALYTPFKNPAIVKATELEYEIRNQVIYFLPPDKKPIGIYVTDKNDRDAPEYKLVIVPSDVPVGQQIKLVPKDGSYFRGLEAKKIMLNAPDYPSMLISMLAETAKEGAATSFKKDTDFSVKPFYLGNVLVVPSKRDVSANYEVLTLEATNRNNETIQLSESDFNKLPKEVGLSSSKQEFHRNAAVGFFPRIVLEPGATTSVYLLRLRDE